MMNWISPALRRLLPFVVGCLFLDAGLQQTYAQTSSDRVETETRLARLRDEIRSEEAKLAATERTESASRNKINSINRQIGMREELVGTYRNRLSSMSVERDSVFSSISNLEGELDRLKEDYRRRATNAYRYGRLHDVALILSASSINEMLVRIQYLNRFSSTRKSRLENISDTAELLKQRRTQLQRMLVRNEVLLQDTEDEQKELSTLKRSREVVIDRAQIQRDDLTQSLAEKRSSADQLNSRIRVLISDSNMSNAEASEALGNANSRTFRNRKGRLPRPAAGTIKEPFGEVINSERGTRTNNLHIVIETEASAEVSAVSEGAVSAIDVMPEYGRFILVEHGNYLTFYGNLSLFYVSVGDTVTPGQIIGRAGTDAEPKGRAIFFGIFENGNAVDPEIWIQ